MSEAMFELELITDEGSFVIDERNLPISDELLQRFGISNSDLEQCFAEIRELARTRNNGRARAERLDGKWVVTLVAVH